MARLDMGPARLALYGITPVRGGGDRSSIVDRLASYGSLAFCPISGRLAHNDGCTN